MEVILIRHADPNYERDTITALGHLQAKALAQTMKNSPPDFLYVSPLGRAQSTYRHIADVLDANSSTLEWLKEVGGGTINGYAAWEHPGDDYLRRNKFAPLDRWWEGFAAGEELKPYFKTISNGFDNLVRKYGYSKKRNLYQIEEPNKKVIALVSHKGTILTLLSYLLHWSLPLIYIHTELKAASITRLYWKEVNKRYAIPKLIVLNDCSHLRDLPRGKE